MSRLSCLIFVALGIFSVYCQPLEPENATSTKPGDISALLNDPNMMAAFAQFLQQQNALNKPTEQVQTQEVVSVTQPSVAIVTVPQNPPSTQTVASVEQSAPVLVQSQPEAVDAVTQPSSVLIVPAQTSPTVVSAVQTDTSSQQNAAVQVQPQVQPEATVPVIVPASQNPASLESRAPFPVVQPQTVAQPQQPVVITSQVQEQPTAQPTYVVAPVTQPPFTTVVAPQNPPIQTVVQQPQPLPAQETSFVQAQPQTVFQPQNQVFTTQNQPSYTVAQPQYQTQPQLQPQTQPIVGSTFPQWSVPPSTNTQVYPQPQPAVSSSEWPLLSLPNSYVQLTPQPQENLSVQKWGNVRIATAPRAKYVPVPDPLTPEQRKKQAEAAHYEFSTYEDDNIKGSFLSRSEVRRGLKVVGQYGYDDGHVNRMVYYEADDKGFRIVKEEMKPSIKTGVLDGTAKVQIVQDGTQVDYQITKKDIASSPVIA